MYDRVYPAVVLPLLVCNLQDPWTLVPFENATNVVLVRWGSRCVGRYSGMFTGARTLVARGRRASGRPRVRVRALFVRVSLCGEPVRRGVRRSRSMHRRRGRRGGTGLHGLHGRLTVLLVPTTMSLFWGRWFRNRLLRPSWLRIP